MAIVILNEKVPTRTPALSGAVYVYNRRGQTIAAKWPRKRGPAKTLVHKEQTAWFTQCRKIMKWAIAQQQIQTREASHRTPFLPGDLLMAAAAGRLAAVYYANGDYYRGYRAMTDVSKSLDVISNVPGSMLIRGEDNWIAQPFDGAGGSSFVWARDPGVTGTTSSSGYAFKGSVFVPFVSGIVTALAAQFTGVAGGTYKMVLGTIDGSGQILTITSSDELVIADSYRRVHVFNITAELTQGKTCFLMVGRLDAGNAYAMPIYFNGGSYWSFPAGANAGCRIANANPQVGDTLASFTLSDIPPVGMQIAF